MGKLLGKGARVSLDFLDALNFTQTHLDDAGAGSGGCYRASLFSRNDRRAPLEPGEHEQTTTNGDSILQHGNHEIGNPESLHQASTKFVTRKCPGDSADRAQ